MTSFTDAWSRFRNRVRFGLATQEVLDRIAGLGLVIYPYFVVEEPVRASRQFEGIEGLQTRVLHREDVPLLASLPERPRDGASIRAQMDEATCVAILENGELLGYSWYRRDFLGSGLVACRMIALPADCAYLFDMFVCRKARGRNVAALLRNEVHRNLAAQGVKHAFSISLAFNRSTRRFKAKLGAVEVELRLHLRLKPFAGLDFRMRRKPWRLCLPALYLSRPGSSARP